MPLESTIYLLYIGLFAFNINPINNQWFISDSRVMSDGQVVGVPQISSVGIKWVTQTPWSNAISECDICWGAETHAVSNKLPPTLQITVTLAKICLAVFKTLPFLWNFGWADDVSQTEGVRCQMNSNAVSFYLKRSLLCLASLSDIALQSIMCIQSRMLDFIRVSITLQKTNKAYNDLLISSVIASTRAKSAILRRRHPAGVTLLALYIVHRTNRERCPDYTNYLVNYAWWVVRNILIDF